MSPTKAGGNAAGLFRWGLALGFPDKEKQDARERCHRKLVGGLLLISADERPAAISEAIRE
jgi:hypothetical protein